MQLRSLVLRVFRRDRGASAASRNRAPRGALSPAWSSPGLAVGYDSRPLHANGVEVLVGRDAELHPRPAAPEPSAAALFDRVNREPRRMPLAVAGEGAAMALPPGAIRATEPKALRSNGRVNVSRVALLGRDPDVIADVARVPRMNLCYVTTHVHWAEHGRVAERERIVLSARRRCSDKSDSGNSGDRKQTS